MASVIVAFPIFLWVTQFINRETGRHPEKASAGVRRWLTYVLLLLPAGFFIADLVTLLTYFLRGELTGRFVSKVAVVLVLAAGIFTCYLEPMRLRAGKTDE